MERWSEAALEALALVSGFDDVAMIGEAVEERRRHLGVTEHCRLPLISNGRYLVSQCIAIGC
jgi:hypothetical protein